MTFIQVCIVLISARIERKAFQPGNPMGKDPGVGNFLAQPSYRENFNVVEAS